MSHRMLRQSCQRNCSPSGGSDATYFFLIFFRIFLEPGRLDPPLCLIMLCRLPIVFIFLSCCAVAKATDDSRSFFEISSDSGCLVEGNILSVAKNTLWISLDGFFSTRFVLWAILKCEALNMFANLESTVSDLHQAAWIPEHHLQWHAARSSWCSF